MADTKLTSLVGELTTQPQKLSPAAARLTLKDLLVLNSGDWAQAPSDLTVKDLASLSSAFEGELTTLRTSLASACCCSSIICCCTAASDPSPMIVL